jgi:hypothetical protein
MQEISLKFMCEFRLANFLTLLLTVQIAIKKLVQQLITDNYDNPD